jgi:hypothetical protein
MIDYQILARSVDYYESCGFKRIESPWTVTKEISRITSQTNATFFSIEEKNKVLVASGEQSFLYLYNKGFLPKGKFQTITPCFRDEPFDSLHTKYFIKNELIKTDSTTDDDLRKVVDDAFKFYSKYVNGVSKLKVVKTGSLMFDIVYEDVELGSYGIRQCDFLTWIYGTGVAEPRLSNTLLKYGIPHKEN